MSTMTALLAAAIIDCDEEMTQSTDSLLTEDCCTVAVDARADHFSSIELESGSEGRDDDNAVLLDAVTATCFNVESRSSYSSLTQFDNTDNDNAELHNTNCINTGSSGSKEPLATASTTTAIESERIDVAKFLLILLVVIGHFIEPYYKAGNNKFASTIMHLIYSFHVPAFVFLSGYTSGLLCGDNKSNGSCSRKKRWHRQRRAIARLLLPYLIMQPLFCMWYTSLYYKGDDNNNGLDDQNANSDENNPIQIIMEFTPNWTLYNLHPWTMSHPFAHLWYLVSLLTMRIWAPYALELRYTVPIHMLLGCCIGYSTDYNRFLSLHRTVVLMPYFLCGALMRGGRWNNCFVPQRFANSIPSRIVVGCIMVTTLVGAAIFAVEVGLPVEIWFQSDPYDEVFKQEYAMYGGLVQLGCYAVSSMAMATFFVFVPSPSGCGVVVQTTCDVVEIAAEKGEPDDCSSGRTTWYCATRRQRPGQALERKQETVYARIYLRLAKWGQRSLYAYILHVAVLILFEQAGYYDKLWSGSNQQNNPNNDWRAVLEVAGTMALACILTIGLVLRPIFPTAFQYIFEPKIECAFHDEE